MFLVPSILRLTEIFLGSRGVHDVNWSKSLVEKLKREEHLLLRLNGVAIVKIRDPSQNASQGIVKVTKNETSPSVDLQDVT